MVLSWLAIGATPRSLAADDKMAVIATIEGEPILLGEFLLHLEAGRANVYAHFQGLKPIEDTDRFWNTEYEGVTPLAYLKSKALQDLKAIKVQQHAARQAGLVDDTGYAAFRRRYEAENDRRANAMRKGEAVYGPARLDEWTFYQHELAQLITRFKRFAAEDTLRVTDEETRQYYERKKAERYRVPYTISAEVLRWTIGDATKEDAARNSLQIVRRDAVEGKSLAVCAASSLPEASELQIATCEIDRNTAAHYNKTAPELMAAVAPLQPGEVSEIIESNSQLILVKCNTRQAGGFLPYEDFQYAIRRDCGDEKYRAFVDALAAKADVVIDQKVYDHIGL